MVWRRRYRTFKWTVYYFQLQSTHADPINKTFATVPWPHAFAQLFIGWSTVQSVFPPLSSHLRHFSCHSWRFISWRQTIERERGHMQPRSLTKWFRNLCTDYVLRAVSSLSSSFCLLCTPSHICFYSFQSSNIVPNSLSLQGLSCKNWLFKGLILLYPVQLIYPTSILFIFTIYQLKVFVYSQLCGKTILL